MRMRCERCDGEVSEQYRFCPWCAAPQRTKLVEHFRAHPLVEQDAVALRVSRYLVDLRHTRVSIWDAERAVAAISLEEREAVRLSRFLAATGRSRAKPAQGFRARAEELMTEMRLRR